MLRDLQRAMAASILTGVDGTDTIDIVEDGVLAAVRLAVYRGTCAATLTKALQTTFVAVERLVGEDFFASAAAHFVDADPPRSAYLDLYGENFPAFLRDFSPAAPLPYLGDVAQLEWCMAAAARADNKAPLTPDDLATLSADHPETLRLAAHPSYATISVDYAVDDICFAVLAQDGDDSRLAALDMSKSPRHYAVYRAQRGVNVRKLDDEGSAFLQRLWDGEALLKVVDDDTSPAMLALFADYLTNGCFIQGGPA
jgi:hypothetical protein